MKRTIATMTPPIRIVASAKDRWRLHRVYRKVLRLMPSNGDLTAFTEAVSADRKRRIVITPVVVGPGEPSGAWYPHTDYDEIRIDRNATPASYVVTLCHEFCHMFLGHGDTTGEQIEPPPTTMIRSDIAQRLFLARDGYEQHGEGDSEQLATWLATEVRRRQHLAEASSDKIGQRLR